MSIQSFLNRRPNKNEVAHGLKSTFWLRVHAFILVTWCAAIGYGTTKLLYWGGLDSMGVRYAISVAAAYGAFLLGVRLWLSYIGFEEYMKEDDDHIDGADAGLDVLDIALPRGHSHTSVTKEFTGGGGTFDGGGATGDWEGAGRSVSSGVSGSDVSIDGDALPFIVIVALLFAVFVVFTGGVYLGAELLAELAFEMLLAIHIRRGIKRGGLPWLASAFKNTWWVLLLVMAITVAAGTIAQKTYGTDTAMATVRVMVAQQQEAK